MIVFLYDINDPSLKKKCVVPSSLWFKTDENNNSKTYYCDCIVQPLCIKLNIKWFDINDCFDRFSKRWCHVSERGKTGRSTPTTSSSDYRTSSWDWCPQNQNWYTRRGTCMHACARAHTHSGKQTYTHICTLRLTHHLQLFLCKLISEQ